MQKDYTNLSSTSLSELNTLVKPYINNGWQSVGSVIVHQADGNPRPKFFQTLIKVNKSTF